MKKIVFLFCFVTLSARAAFLPIPEYQNFSGVLSQTLNETLKFDNEGFSTIGFYAVPPTTGAVTFEASFDGGATWEYISLRSITDDLWESRIDATANYIGSIAGTTNIRFKTTTGGSGDGSVIGVFMREVAISEGLEFGHPPHKFGYLPIHVDAHYSTAQTATVLFAADADKQSVITDIYFVVSGSTDCTVKIYDETDSTGNYLFYADVEVATNKNFLFAHSFLTPYVASAAGNSLKLTTDAACTIDINGHGYQF